MNDDKEIQAIASVNQALKDLSEEERYRVIQWLANKYVQNIAPFYSSPNSVAPKVISGGVVNDDSQEGEADESSNERPAFDTFAELLDKSGASSEAENTLIAAYWVQVLGNKSDWKSFELNKLMKDTGNAVKYMTNPIKQLSAKKPALVVQVSKKSVTSGKGSKTMKLTSEGIKVAERMISKS